MLTHSRHIRDTIVEKVKFFDFQQALFHQRFKDLIYCMHASTSVPFDFTSTLLSSRLISSGHFLLLKV